MSANSSVFNHLPIHLRGEIIQIGAVKLNEDWTPAGEFQIDVRPVYFRKMHFKVKKLTGIDAQQLSTACGFKEAFARFREFCGDDCTFLTWGYDDKGILEQNIIIHDEDWDWISGWVNLQLIYNMQTEGDRNQKSLSTAMEHFEIPQTRVAHNALGDAYNTALVCSRLDMEQGLRDYEDLAHRLALRSAGEDGYEGPLPAEHVTFSGFLSRNAVFDDPGLCDVRCPDCGAALELQRWVNQGDRRYMALGSCPEHGAWLVRVKLKFGEDETWSANRILYRADQGMENFYRKKALQGRKRTRRRRRNPPQEEKPGTAGAPAPPSAED